MWALCFTASLALSMMVSVDANPVPTVTQTECQNISQAIRTYCFTPDTDHMTMADWCNDLPAYVEAFHCTNRIIGHCNPHAIPFMPTEPEVRYNINVTCGDPNVRPECLRRYIHDQQQLGSCVPQTIRTMRTNTISRPCKIIRAGISCGLRDVRTCDAHTAQVMTRASEPHIERICQAPIS